MNRLLSKFKDYVNPPAQPPFDQAPLTGAAQDVATLRGQLDTFRRHPEQSGFNSDEELRVQLKGRLKILRDIVEAAPENADTKHAYTEITQASLFYHEQFSSGLLPAETLNLITEQIESDFAKSDIADTTLLESLYERMIDNHLKTTQSQRDTICTQMQNDTLNTFYIRNDQDLQRFNDKMLAHTTSAQTLVEKLSQYGKIDPETIHKVATIAQTVNEFSSLAADYVQRVKETRDAKTAASFNQNSFPQQGSYKGFIQRTHQIDGAAKNHHTPYSHNTVNNNDRTLVI